MAKAFNLRVIAAGASMVACGHHLVIDDENRAKCNEEFPTAAELCDAV